MIEAMFYIIWKGSISKRWRTLGEDMAKIAWRQRHSELSSISDADCKNACEKLVMEPDIKYAPALGSVVKRIVHESQPKAKNPFENEDESYTRPTPEFKKLMLVARRVATGNNLARKLQMYEMLPGIWQEHGVTVSQDEHLYLANLCAVTKRSLEQWKADAPVRKAAKEHEKKLTHAERIALARKRRAERQTVGNALGRVLK